MKASELIAKLRELMQTTGDREVRLTLDDPMDSVGISDVVAANPSQKQRKDGAAKALVVVAQEETK